MNLFGWFGSGTEETKEDDNDNVTINNNNEFDLLDMPNSFLQQPRRTPRIATKRLQHV